MHGPVDGTQEVGEGMPDDVLRGSHGYIQDSPFMENLPYLGKELLGIAAIESGGDRIGEV